MGIVGVCGRLSVVCCVLGVSVCVRKQKVQWKSAARNRGALSVAATLCSASAERAPAAPLDDAVCRRALLATKKVSDYITRSIQRRRHARERARGIAGRPVQRRDRVCARAPKRHHHKTPHLGEEKRAISHRRRSLSRKRRILLESGSAGCQAPQIFVGDWNTRIPQAKQGGGEWEKERGSARPSRKKVRAPLGRLSLSLSV